MESPNEFLAVLSHPVERLAWECLAAVLTYSVNRSAWKCCPAIAIGVGFHFSQPR
jgi:hypothetical protein